MECVRIIVSGRVQGVFFRHNAKLKAVELGIRGYVKNLENGDVEVVAQGDTGKISEIVGFLRKNPGNSKVEKIEIEKIQVQNFKSFGIILP